MLLQLQGPEGGRVGQEGCSAEHCCMGARKSARKYWQVWLYQSHMVAPRGM